HAPLRSRSTSAGCTRLHRPAQPPRSPATRPAVASRSYSSTLKSWASKSEMIRDSKVDLPACEGPTTRMSTVSPGCSFAPDYPRMSHEHDYRDDSDEESRVTASTSH